VPRARRGGSKITRKKVVTRKRSSADKKGKKAGRKGVTMKRDAAALKKIKAAKKGKKGKKM